MKRTTKLISLLLALLVTLSLVSCAASQDSNGGVYDDYSPSVGGSPNAPSNVPNADESGPDDGTHDGFVENPFVATLEQPVSTFSADVDTASYAYFRKLVNQGQTLSQLFRNGAAFRTEEFINYFKYDLPRPAEGELFGVQTDVTASPWNASTMLLRISLQAEAAVNTEGNNLVFLIDVSGSMNAADKLPLLQQSFSLLTESLTEHDIISIVTYSGKEAVVLDGCRGNERARILNAIEDLVASGSTNGEAGLNKAYTLAKKHFIAGGNNRIIMASDGDLNVGISSQSELTAYVEAQRAGGVYLSVLGFGTGNYRDANMEALADHGNGVYYYIDGPSEAERVFGTDLLGTLYTVAKDVKLQLTFDPAYVTSYRLIGYENRVLDNEDFEDDTKDAGEVGANHQVTVFYELTLGENARATEADWMTLAVRYKHPNEDTSRLNEYTVGAAELLESPTADLTFMHCVIRTAAILHDSPYLEGDSLAGIVETLEGLELSDHPEREEFLNLLKKLIG